MRHHVAPALTRDARHRGVRRASVVLTTALETLALCKYDNMAHDIYDIVLCDV